MDKTTKIIKKMDLFFVRKRKKGLIESPLAAVTPVIGENEGPYRCHNNSCSSPHHSTQSWAKVCKIRQQYLH